MNTNKDDQEEISRSYRVAFSIVRDLGPDNEPDHYIYNINGEIICTEDSHTKSLEIAAGTMNGYLINVDRIRENGISLFDACDAHSQTIHDYGCVVFDFGQSELKPSIKRQFGDICFSNVLILDKVEVLPEHRTRGVGLTAAYCFLDTFEVGCGLTVCEPYPMQFRDTTPEHVQWCEKMGTESFVIDKRRATAKLRAYWSRLGFQRIRRSKIYALSLERRRPSLRQLVADI